MEKHSLVAMVMATMVEAKPFVTGMSLAQTEKKPFAVFKKNNLMLIISGIGKANAAMAAGYICQLFNPSLVCNLGAAGATDSNYPLGEVLQIKTIFEYDRPEFKTGKPHIHMPDTIKGFKTAVLATSDKVVIEPDHRKEVSFHAGLVDMEGASVVQACRRFETKCFVFKFVSDTPDHTGDDDIVNHIKELRTHFYEVFSGTVMPLLKRKHR